MKEPMYSDMQYPYHRDQNGPTPLPPFVDEFDDIVSQLRWRLFDFCRIHHIVYAEMERWDQKLDQIPKEAMDYQSDQTMEDIKKIRLRQAVVDKDIENKRIASFSDQIMVVGLWAICEQFVSKTYRRAVSMMNNCEESSISVPYRWDQIKLRFSDIGIDIEGCENYQNADECRALNNAIKHDPLVSDKLAAYGYFESYEGKVLDSVPLEMQRYLNGISDFLGSLIERSNQATKA
ncbi:hypothetical protein [Thiomicrospira microaerophila]|uniref:hypothetical protein n=1 Tax=Thiomicrospira microaerophila TaxID=406020 RepID=UPI0005CB3224|nr:hypothetical protein [Thiomicrospira microaerophila]